MSEDKLPENSLWTNIFKHIHKVLHHIYNIMRGIPIFRDLTRKEMRAVEHILHHRSYKKDEVVFNEDEPGVGMYIIESGAIHIKMGNEQNLLAVLTRGDFFGEMALLLESPRSATAVATKPANLLGFFQPDLFDLLKRHPETGNKILYRLSQMIAERLKHTITENTHLKARIHELERREKGGKG